MNDDSTSRERSDLVRHLRTRRQPSQPQLLVFLIDHDGGSVNVPTTGFCDVASGYTGGFDTNRWADWFDYRLRDLLGATSPEQAHIYGFSDVFADSWRPELRQLLSECDIEPVELPPFEKIGRIMGKPKPVRRLELLPGLKR